MSTSCIEPKGNTFSPKNPRRWVLTGSILSLPMPILSMAEAKMRSAVGHNCLNYQGVVMGVLASLQVRVRESYGCVESR